MKTYLQLLSQSMTTIRWTEIQHMYTRLVHGQRARCWTKFTCVSVGWFTISSRAAPEICDDVAFFFSTSKSVMQQLAMYAVHQQSLKLLAIASSSPSPSPSPSPSMHHLNQISIHSSFGTSAPTRLWRHLLSFHKSEYTQRKYSYSGIPQAQWSRELKAQFEIQGLYTEFVFTSTL